MTPIKFRFFSLKLNFYGRKNWTQEAERKKSAAMVILSKGRMDLIA